MNTLINKLSVFSRVIEGLASFKTRYFEVNSVNNCFIGGYSALCLIINIMYPLKRLFLQAFSLIYTTQLLNSIDFQGLRSEQPYFTSTLNHCSKSLYNGFSITKQI
jgi:hypothetical protein